MSGTLHVALLGAGGMIARAIVRDLAESEEVGDLLLLDADCDYLDLGGLHWMTDRQLELHERFQRAGRLAVLGMGSGPGKTNVMAVRAVREASFRLSLAPALQRRLEELRGAAEQEVAAAQAAAAALVRLLARGHVRRVGVHPPEKCVDPDDLFPELERRGCRFEVTVS